MGYKFSWSPRGALMNMLSGAKYLKDGHPVMVDKDGRLKNILKFLILKTLK